MYLNTVLILSMVIGASWALDPSSFIPNARSCGVTFGKVLKPHSWVCEDSQFQTYPKTKVDNLLMTDLYNDTYEQLMVTHGCQKYRDNDQIYGQNEYYTYESICKMIRKPIRVIWAEVPHYTVPNNLKTLNGGLLPCHVLEGQSLFDVECVHPWATGIPRHYSRRMQRRLRRIRFDGVKRNLCLVGYAYNYNMMCRPTGYMTREVLVYSEHADRIFTARVDNVPTSCACAYCKCNPKLNQTPAIV